MRRLLSAVLLALVFGAAPFRAAPSLAAEQTSQQAYAFVGEAHADLWKHTSGEWQKYPDPNPGGGLRAYRNGDTGFTMEVTYSPTVLDPQALDKWTFTGVEVFPIDGQASFERAGGVRVDERGIRDWSVFQKEDFLHRARLQVRDAGFDPATGKVRVRWSYDLAPPEKTTADLETPRPWDLTKAEIRTKLRIPPPPGGFASVVEGYRYELPVGIVWYGIPKAKPDFYVKSLNPGASEVEEGRRYTGKVVFGLKNTVSVPVKAKLELTHNGYPVPGVNGQIVTFSPGEEKSYSFNFSGQHRDSVLEAKIRPVEGNDADWSNNSKRVVVPLRQQQSGPGSLTFKAVSQDRTKKRPDGTAKWTDWVTATLRPPAPTPPRGWLDWWEVTSATLTYPKKNPEFTFGTPYPPVGTRTVSMKPALYEGGYAHGATVEFQEDWAMDGAQIYSIIEGRLMAEEPKYYTLSARYTIKYQYSYVECDEDDCWTVTKTATTSGTVSGKLLVNGTGVDSRSM